MRSSCDWRSAAAATFLAALILYGSLYPFRFHPVYFPHGLLRAFLATAYGRVDRGDVISNILLYLPLGYFAVRVWPVAPAPVRVMAMIIAGAILSTSIELAQFYDLGRGPSFFDAASNTAGMAIGAVAGAISTRFSVAGMLLAAWFGARLLPYVPALDPAKYAAALRELTAPIEPVEAFRSCAMWLAAAALFESLLQKSAARALVIGIIAVFSARIFIAGAFLSSSEIAGAGIAAILWIGYVSRLERRAAAVCCVLIAALALEALTFPFTPYSRRFAWVPFRDLMSGPREAGSRVFLEKAFEYGALLWFACRAGFSLPIAAISAFLLVLGLRMAQFYFARRPAGFTDAIIVLIFGVFIALFPD
ncbi:MAG TPA: VanZ family protein [Bryobacteraceae bacterium]|jgi:VanZ family protein|nr:VanZ family protein [Bryobacteraceae bacterium]